ncbi:MAG: hypothetical protein KDK28_13440, partial [Maritimibacter sp.]|nr:hypothetical protein [Maritimibacter sp.]
ALGMEQTPRTFTLPDTAAHRQAVRLAAHTSDDPLHADVCTPDTGDVTALAVLLNKPFTFVANNGKTIRYFPATGTHTPRARENGGQYGRYGRLS